MAVGGSGDGVGIGVRVGVGVTDGVGEGPTVGVVVAVGVVVGVIVGVGVTDGVEASSVWRLLICSCSAIDCCSQPAASNNRAPNTRASA